MTHQPIMECVRIRPFREVAAADCALFIDKNWGIVLRCGDATTGRPSPLHARVAMALAPLPKLSGVFSKHVTLSKLLWNIPHVSFALIFISGVEFIELQGPDGQRAFLNPRTISSLREPIASDLKSFTKGVRCVVVTTSGKFIAVVETCTYIRDTLDKKP
jgi:hypothetical protein